MPLHSLIDDDTDGAESTTARALRDAPELARVVDQIAGSWQWAGEDVRGMLLAGLQAMAGQLDAQRQRQEATPRGRPSASQTMDVSDGTDGESGTIARP